MRVLIQRVSEASVSIEEQVKDRIGRGLLLLIGIEHNDNAADLEWMASKIVNMRIFSDEAGKMNLSLLDVQGALLAISQFTLHANTKKGNRPSFIKAARPEKAIPLYEQFLQQLTKLIDKPVASGKFGADMQVALVNDGPVTILIDSQARE